MITTIIIIIWPISLILAYLLGSEQRKKKIDLEIRKRSDRVIDTYKRSVREKLSQQIPVFDHLKEAREKRTKLITGNRN